MNNSPLVAVFAALDRFARLMHGSAAAEAMTKYQQELYADLFRALEMLYRLYRHDCAVTAIAASDEGGGTITITLRLPSPHPLPPLAIGTTVSLIVEGPP